MVLNAEKSSLHLMKNSYQTMMKINKRCIQHCLKKGYSIKSETTGNLLGIKIAWKITKAASKGTCGEPMGISMGISRKK